MGADKKERLSSEAAANPETGSGSSVSNVSRAHAALHRFLKEAHSLGDFFFCTYFLRANTTSRCNLVNLMALKPHVHLSLTFTGINCPLQ